MRDIICCFFTVRRQILIYERKKSAYFADFFRLVLPAGIAPLAARPDEQRVSAVQFACVWSLPIGFFGKPLAPARVSTLDSRRTFLCIRKQKKPAYFTDFFVWYSRRESNPQRPLRRGLLYPFNYGSILSFNISAIPASAGICCNGNLYQGRRIVRCFLR